MRLYYFSFIFCMLFLGCHRPLKSTNVYGSQSSIKDHDPLIDFREYINNKRFHVAFLLYESIAKEWTDSDEGALQFELNFLISQTARFGVTKWDDIFKDPRIELKLKEELIREIDEQSRENVAATQNSSQHK